jgi:hypothetical protein
MLMTGQAIVAPSRCIPSGFLQAGRFPVLPRGRLVRLAASS